MQKYQHNGMNGENMADKLGIGPEVRELKLGPSFTSSRGGESFHTLRCKLRHLYKSMQMTFELEYL